MVEDNQQIGSDGTHDGPRYVDFVGHVSLIFNERAPANEQQSRTSDEGEELRVLARYRYQYGCQTEDDGGDDGQPEDCSCTGQIEY